MQIIGTCADTYPMIPLIATVYVKYISQCQIECATKSKIEKIIDRVEVE